MVSGDIGDPYTYWAADLSNKHFAYSIDVHQVQSHLTFFISDNKSMADVDTFFSISGSAAIANTTQRQINTNTKRTANTKIPKPKKTQIQKIPSKHKYKVKHKHEKT